MRNPFLPSEEGLPPAELDLADELEEQVREDWIDVDTEMEGFLEAGVEEANRKFQEAMEEEHRHD